MLSPIEFDQTEGTVKSIHTKQIEDGVLAGYEFHVDRILFQKVDDNGLRMVLYDDDTSHHFRNCLCFFDSVSFTAR